MFGPDFVIPDEAEDLGDKVAEMSVDDSPAAAQDFRSKKTKATARFGSHKHQFQVMQSQGMSNEQIAKFAYAQHWLEYYPPIAIEHLKSMGCKIDWRRAFLTTDYNPYYDSFARWQFERLHEMGKIKFGKRYTIWSAKDGQPCMDHDRKTGEGVNPQEYTGIKLQVLEWSEQGNKVISAIPQLEGKKIFLVAATLRPETMYGQTNCFVGTGLEYGFYQSENPNEVYVVTARVARNMAFQGLTPANGQAILLGTVNGQAIIGSKVDAPLSTYSSGVYVLPMENVLATKSTGVVTSVSSESPDDYAVLRYLKKKTEYYGIKPEWVDEFEPVPVTSIPAFDAMPASALCKNVKISLQKDRVQLAETKDAVYKEGFYNSTMSVDDFKGKYVQAANMKVRDLLIANGSGFAYAESEKPVMSRSADDCVVALCDQ
ncbi:cytosolic leucyl tRNA synthetase [Coemansia sp. RSA 1358]|nr:cytosolic leucyl tRNA synthetase [Coemansia sp. RSA 1358]